MERSIYTLIRGADWREAERTGHYAGSADDARDGFLHFSTASQVRESAAKHRRGERDLWLVEADAALLGDALKWEPASGGRRAGLFPHLYGKLPIAAVLSATQLRLLHDGSHAFPSSFAPLPPPLAGEGRGGGLEYERNTAARTRTQGAAPQAGAFFTSGAHA